MNKYFYFIQITLNYFFNKLYFSMEFLWIWLSDKAGTWNIQNLNNFNMVSTLSSELMFISDFKELNRKYRLGVEHFQAVLFQGWNIQLSTHFTVRWINRFKAWFQIKPKEFYLLLSKYWQNLIAMDMVEYSLTVIFLHWKTIRNTSGSAKCLGS